MHLYIDRQSIYHSHMASNEERDVVEEMQREFNRQTAKYPKLWEAFAKEDPSVFRVEDASDSNDEDIN